MDFVSIETPSRKGGHFWGKNTRYFLPFLSINFSSTNLVSLVLVKFPVSHYALMLPLRRGSEVEIIQVIAPFQMSLIFTCSSSKEVGPFKRLLTDRAYVRTRLQIVRVGEGRLSKGREGYLRRVLAKIIAS